MSNRKVIDKVKLYEICDIKSGGTPSREKREYWSNGEIPWVKIGDFNGKYIDTVEETITYEGLKNSSAKMIEKGSILFTIFATIGEVAILKFDVTTNQAIAGITVTDSRVEKEYLYYYLKSIKTNINNKGRGVAQNNINLSILKNLEVPIVSLKYQKNIVSILNRIDYIIELRIRQLNKINELTKSLFIEMFGDVKSNSKKWIKKQFTDIALIDTNMLKNFDNYENYPHIGIDSIEKETGEIIGYRTVQEDKVVSGKYLFTQQHIIYSKIRPNLNKVALPNFNGVCSADAYPILVKNKKCHRVFLAYIMRSKLFLDYIIKLSNRTNLPKVNKKQVEGFICPVPPLDLQNRFAEYVSSIDKSKLAVKKSLEELEILKKSLMQKYFA